MARPTAAARRPPVKELPSTPAGGYDDVSELLGVVVDHERRRGRGAQSNASGRYARSFTYGRHAGRATAIQDK